MKQQKILYQQTFDYEVPDYEWDGVRENLVEKSTKRNLVEEINSYKDCRLDSVLDKFLNPDTNIDMSSVESIVDLDECNQDLLRMGELIALADDYRERYNLPLSMSVSDVYSFIDKQSQMLSDELKKGVKVDEAKKNVEESK